MRTVCLSRLFFPDCCSVNAHNCPASIVIFSDLLPASFSGQGLLDSLLFSRLQIERVLLHFLDNVFGLNLPFKATKCVLKGFTLLKSYFSHSSYTSPAFKVVYDYTWQNLVDFIGVVKCESFKFNTFRQRSPGIFFHLEEYTVLRQNEASDEMSGVRYWKGS